MEKKRFTFTVVPILVALITGLANAPTNIYKVCAWNVGTLKIEPWRRKTTAMAKDVARDIKSWFARLWSPRVLFACSAVLLALLVVHLSAGHASGHELVLATVPATVPVVPLKDKRAELVRAAEALKSTDGSFKDDETRSAFDAKMAEIEALDKQIRAAETTAANPTDLDAVRKEAATAERERAAGIRKAVSVAKLESAVADDMIGRGITIEAARSEIFEKMAAASDKTPTSSRIAVGEDAKDKFLRGATNWLIVKSGMAPIIARATKVEVSSFDPGEFRGMTLVELARETLVRAGRQVSGRDKMQIVGDAFTLRDGAITQSTSDFSTLLENLMHKTLQAAYAITPDTWRRFCATSTVSDFRVQNRYRMGTFGPLDTLNENGEFKNKQITDAEKATITAATKGNIINVSRQMIVNDDMNAFSRLLTMLGRAAALSVEVDVYALLAQNAGLGPSMPYDSTTLFHANHGNISTGAALSAAALDADRVLMAQQKDKDSNDFIDLRPAILVIGVGLGGQARVINGSQYDPDATANKAINRPNVVVGLFSDIVDSPRVTAISTTRRYLFADPSIAPVLEVAFLEGQSAPVLETQDGWRTDGTEMKVRFDYGVAAVDHRGAITNAGA